MIAITNQYGLPRSYVRAVSEQREAKPYTISVTQLIKPPQMLALELQHRDEMVADAADFIDMFFGTAIHHYLDHFSATAASEKTLRWQHDGWTVHGTPDHSEWIDFSEDAVLTDWKTTKVRALGYDKPEWEQQVNLYAHLLRLNGTAVGTCQVWAFLKDWDKARLSEPEYPRAPICLVPIPLWDAATAHVFMLKRLELHEQALEAGVYGPCTAEEKWQRDSWAVWSLKGQPAKPHRVMPTEPEALEWAIAKLKPLQKLGDWWELEHRRGAPLRCQQYCDAAPFCSQKAAEDRQGHPAPAEPFPPLSLVRGSA